MRKLVVAITATIVVLSALIANRAEATPLGAAVGATRAVDALNPVTTVRYGGWWGGRGRFFHHRGFFHHRRFFHHRHFFHHRFHHRGWGY